MKIQMRKNIRLLALGAVLAVAASAAAAKGDADDCCNPGTVVYYDDAGSVVGVRMWGCGDPGWGEVTSHSKAFNGCIM